MPSIHMFIIRLLLVLLTLHPHAIPLPPGTGAAAAAGDDDDTLMPGQAFTVGNKLVSSNGKFALGFFQPGAGTGHTNKPSSSTSPPGWYLGIWFNKIPLVTPVWVANRERPILKPYLSTTQLQISRDGNLMLIVVSNSNNATTTTTTKSVVIWSTSTHIPKANNTAATTCRAILKNSGNLVIEESLEGAGPSNATTTMTTTVWLWQSFDYPTNALLPHAKIGWNKATGLNRVGIPWKSQVDPGLGSFRIGLDTDATTRNNVTIRRRIYPDKTYWRWSPDAAGGMKIPELRALLHMNPLTSGLVVPEYVNNGEEEYYMYTSPDESSSTFFSIETNGQVKMNVWSHGNQSWYSIFVQPVDPCGPYATCGPFTVCSGSSHPPCDCMETFSRTSPQDWDLGDRTGGCSRNTPLDCGGNGNTGGSSSTDVFHAIARVTLPYGPQSSLHTVTRSECQRVCLGNCSCTAYSYQDTRCSVWHGKLFGVNLDDGIEISSEDSLYIRLAAGDFPSLTRGTTRKPLPVGAITAASVIGSAVLLLIIVIVISRKRFKYYWCGVSSLAPTSQARVGVSVFSYADLGRATRNFSEKLGEGGFGSVYKGVLGDRSTVVAVKRLDGVRQGEKQFRAEVSALGLIQHMNLVKLVGFCCQDDKRLLVYEHMCNGSLDSRLFQRNNATAVLDWNTRYQIALGVARGLSYLHQSCRECIIHCDIKPENILLNESFVPKIADFGLASVIGRDFSRVLTTFKGTMGYLAPEWLSGVPITSKVDVYGFGMVLMEIISGRRNASVVYNTTSMDHVAYFPVHAMSQLHDGDVQSLVDPNLHGNFSLEEAERVCKVACWCIQDNESDRPTMGEVVRVLEGLQDLDIPPMPRLLAAITECSSVATM